VLITTAGEKVHFVFPKGAWLPVARTAGSADVQAGPGAAAGEPLRSVRLRVRRFCFGVAALVRSR
jgi:hypothetical protein